jgi:hypothetical protein
MRMVTTLADSGPGSLREALMGPDGATLNQMPTSTQRTDSKEYVLIFNIPTAENAPPATPDPALAQPALSASTRPSTAPAGIADPVSAARTKKVTATFNKTPLRDVCGALTRDTGIRVSAQIVFMDKPLVGGRIGRTAR